MYKDRRYHRRFLERGFMKKRGILLIAVIVCLTMLLPITLYAKGYEVEETDLSIEIDETYWYVFTRGNIHNNSELDDLGIEYEYMKQLFEKNAIYLDASVFYDDGNYIELFLIKKDFDGIWNLSSNKDEDVLLLAEAVAKKCNANDFGIYKSEYKFMRVEYIDNGMYICEYSTVINGESYILSFQAPSPYDYSEYEEMERIVDSVEFDIKRETNISLWSQILEKAIIGAVVAAIFSGFAMIFVKNKKIQDLEYKDAVVNMGNKKKDRRNTKKAIAIVLLVLQGLGLFGNIINGEIGEIFSEDIWVSIGFFSPAIVGTALLISVKRESKQIEEMIMSDGDVQDM